MLGVSLSGAGCGLSCMPGCCAAAKDDNEFVVTVRNPTAYEAHGFEKFESPVLGFAVAHKGAATKDRKIGDTQICLAESLQNIDGKNNFKDIHDWLSIDEEADGCSTLYDSTSDAMSDQVSVASSDGVLGPQDLMVVGQGLLGSSAMSNIVDDMEGPAVVDSSDRASSEGDDEENSSRPSPGICSGNPRNCVPDWWTYAEVSAVKGLQKSQQVTKLVNVRIIQSKAGPGVPAPWVPGQSSDLYADMGMVDASKSYLAVWLNLGPASLLFIHEFIDRDWMDTCMEASFLTKRLKFISNPVHMRGALPSKTPKDAEAVGAFFGKKNTSCVRNATDAGIPYVCIQVDVFSKWLVKVAFQQIAMRLGNILELLLVDGPSASVLAACRLTMTPELLELLAP